MDAPPQRSDGPGTLMATTDMLSALRSRAQRMIVDNAVALRGAVSGDRPLAERAKRWWDLPAKGELAHQIAGQELARSREAARDAGDDNPHNDAFDAMRHARWSQRMAEEIGPRFAWLAGTEHELEGGLGGQPMAEAMMDLRNNAEGRRAAAEGRPIAARNLQISVNGPASPGNAAYREPSPGGPRRR
jgi:hypothetical protein